MTPPDLTRFSSNSVALATHDLENSKAKKRILVPERADGRGREEHTQRWSHGNELALTHVSLVSFFFKRIGGEKKNKMTHFAFPHLGRFSLQLSRHPSGKEGLTKSPFPPSWQKPKDFPSFSPLICDSHETSMMGLTRGVSDKKNPQIALGVSHRKQYDFRCNTWCLTQ